jgi:hypothetical protein
MYIYIIIYIYIHTYLYTPIHLCAKGVFFWAKKKEEKHNKKKGTYASIYRYIHIYIRQCIFVQRHNPT